MLSPEQPLEPHAPVGKPKGAYCRAWPVIASSVTQAIVPLPDGHFVVAVEVRRQAPAGLAWLLAAPVRATCITSAEAAPSLCGWGDRPGLRVKTRKNARQPAGAAAG